MVSGSLPFRESAPITSTVPAAVPTVPLLKTTGLMYEADRTVSNVTSVWSSAEGGVGVGICTEPPYPPNNPTIAIVLSMFEIAREMYRNLSGPSGGGAPGSRGFTGRYLWEWRRKVRCVLASKRGGVLETACWERKNHCLFVPSLHVGFNPPAPPPRRLARRGPRGAGPGRGRHGDTAGKLGLHAQPDGVPSPSDRPRILPLTRVVQGKFNPRRGAHFQCVGCRLSNQGFFNHISAHMLLGDDLDAGSPPCLSSARRYGWV